MLPISWSHWRACTDLPRPSGVARGLQSICHDTSAEFPQKLVLKNRRRRSFCGLAAQNMKVLRFQHSGCVFIST